ncbi:MAG TPA: MBL fold metallo-hydrolase [Acidobacteriota bacterium]|nr:MBL fold metallo-hydrolase [Acidobacteriota bacterium]
MMVPLYTVVLLLLVTIVQAQDSDPEWCKGLPREAYKKLERVHLTDGWFEVYRIRSGVFAIYEPHQFEEVISYLIVGSQKAMLFDTGMGIGNIANVVKQLTRLPVIVLNSHTHPDHIGGNFSFTHILAADTPFTRRNSAGYSNPEMNEWVKPSQICGNLPEGFDPNAYKIQGFMMERTVKDGEILDLGERKLEVVMTPGHTPDSLCLLDRENRLLFIGDTFYLGPIYLYTLEADFERYAASVKKLASLRDKIEIVLTAHNVPVVAADYLQHLEKAVMQVHAGTIQPKVHEGRREFAFDGFSLLLNQN